jgi:hypothetical protein
MAILRNWKSHRDGNPDEVILAVDFGVTGRPQSGFTDLVPKLDSGLTIWETLPPKTTAEATVTGEEYVSRWLEEVRESGRTVRTVLGYCASSVFACGMCDRIAQWQPQAPQLVVFDPEYSEVTGLCADYLTGVGMFSTILTADEAEEARQAGVEAATASGGDFGQAGVALFALYAKTADTALSRLGLDPELRRELTETFGSYISYLTAARQLELLPRLATATAITSEHSSGRASLAAKEIRFEVTHMELMRDDRVARAVQNALDEYVPAPDGHVGQ